MGLDRKSTLIIDNTQRAFDAGYDKGKAEGGGITPSGTFYINQNGTYDVTQYEKANVDVAVQPKLQEKVATENGIVLPDSEYDGLSKVTVNVGEAGPSVNGYDIATMQKFLDARGKISYLYYQDMNGSKMTSIKDEDLLWLSQVDLSRFAYADYMFGDVESQYWTQIPLFDTSNVQTMRYMFASAQNASSNANPIFIPNFDTAKVTSMENMFYYRKLRNFPSLNYASAGTVNSMFSRATFPENTTIPLLRFPSALSTSFIFKGTNIVACEGIVATHTSNGGFSEVFDGCVSLTRVGNIISGGYSPTLYRLFRDCKKLVSVGTLPSNATNFSSTFDGCESLAIPIRCITTSATNLSYMFRNCYVIDTVEINARSATNVSNIFSGCKALTNLIVKNIKVSLQVGSGTSYGHLLTVDSLVGLCYELRDTGSSKTLTVGTANLEKLATVYVKEIEITDDMRAEDDLIDEKLPFVRCESTDEGATLITDYIQFKNWKVA